MIVSDCIQGSDEWFSERLGRPTASKFNIIVTPEGKPTSGVTREKYLYRLVAERKTMQREDTYTSSPMIDGIETEPEARDTAQFILDTEIKEVGLVYKDERKLYSCSPDGIVLEDNEKGIEIKCPLVSTHISYLDKGDLPNIYKPQVQGSLYITGLDGWYFMSYRKGMEPLLILIEPDLKWHEKFEVAIVKFCEELDTIERKIRYDI